ncbi:MAG TPA: DUF1501 domain-containing protein, partial [Pirellulales bacterium]
MNVSRRRALQSAACGFGYMAFAGMCADSLAAAPSTPALGPLAPKLGHHPAKAKRVIFLFMHGGPSHV